MLHPDTQLQAAAEWFCYHQFHILLSWCSSQRKTASPNPAQTFKQLSVCVLMKTWDGLHEQRKDIFGYAIFYFMFIHGSNFLSGSKRLLFKLCSAINLLKSFAHEYINRKTCCWHISDLIIINTHLCRFLFENHFWLMQSWLPKP